MPLPRSPSAAPRAARSRCRYITKYTQLSGACAGNYGSPSGDAYLSDGSNAATATWQLNYSPPPAPPSVTIDWSNVTHVISKKFSGCHHDPGKGWGQRGVGDDAKRWGADSAKRVVVMTARSGGNGAAGVNRCSITSPVCPFARPPTCRLHPPAAGLLLTDDLRRGVRGARVVGQRGGRRGGHQRSRQRQPVSSQTAGRPPLARALVSTQCRPPAFPLRSPPVGSVGPTCRPCTSCRLPGRMVWRTVASSTRACTSRCVARPPARPLACVPAEQCAVQIPCVRAHGAGH